MPKKLRGSADGLVWVDNGWDYGDDHLALGGHEASLGPLFRLWADPNRVYINVGAHVGTWALRMVPFSSHVYAFEANPATYDTLTANIYYNQMDDNITAIPRPVWDKPGLYFGLIDDNDKRTGGSTRLAEANATMTNASVTLDQFFSRDQYVKDTGVGFITMDVEGAEAHVLRGATDILLRDRPQLVVELHEGHPGTAVDLRQQVYDVLDDCEYDYSSLFVAHPGEHIHAMPKEAAEEFPGDVVRFGE